jgi:hypothetical protein
MGTNLVLKKADHKILIGQPWVDKDSDEAIFPVLVFDL